MVCSIVKLHLFYPRKPIKFINLPKLNNMFDQEFKIALQNLTESEKDKLLFRLIKKDIKLAKKLHFELVDTETVEQKRAQVSEKISNYIQKLPKYVSSLRDVLSHVRTLSGEITDHVNTTKDKFGEISLNIQMLNEIIEAYKTLFINDQYNFGIKLYNYIIARAFKILLLIKAINEDYWMEFSESLADLGQNIGSVHRLMKLAIHNQLNVNWLIEFDIPENLVLLHKELRANGFLK